MRSYTSFVSRGQNFKSHEKTLKSPKHGDDLTYIVLKLKGICRMGIGVELPRNDALLSCGHREEYTSISDMR